MGRPSLVKKRRRRNLSPMCVFRWDRECHHPLLLISIWRAYEHLKIAAKILQVGLYWPTIFRDVHIFITKYYRCQCTRSISRRDEIPQRPIMEVEIFYVWGIDFMGPFPSSNWNKYILVIVNYVSKWIEAISFPTNDAKVVTNMFKNVIFLSFKTPILVIIDGGLHFILKNFKKFCLSME